MVEVVADAGHGLGISEGKRKGGDVENHAPWATYIVIGSGARDQGR